MSARGRTVAGRALSLALPISAGGKVEERREREGKSQEDRTSGREGEPDYVL